MAAYWQGLDQVDINHQGLWTSDAFWQYITSSCTATSPIAEGCARTVHATALASPGSTPPLYTVNASSPVDASHHSNRHNHVFRDNHALLGCSSYALSSCSESRPRFVGPRLTCLVNFRIAV